MNKEELVSFMSDFGSYLTKETLNEESDTYVKGRFRWDLNSHTIKDDKEIDYEKQIEAFLARSSQTIHDTADDDTMILRGGIGTGKSTSLNKCFNSIIYHPRKCSCSKEEDKTCIKTPRLIKLDYRDLLVQDIDEESQLFWSFTESQIAEECKSPGYKENSQDIEFLSWCLDNTCHTRYEEKFQGFILSREQDINQAIGNIDCKESIRRTISLNLNNDFRDFKNNESAKVRAWYQVFRLVYLISLNDKYIETHCNYVFIDNVDHLSPYRQGEAILFAFKLTKILSARTIIAVRPLTYENTRHFHFLIKNMEHRAPSCFKVINTRFADFLRTYTGTISQNEKYHIKEFLKIMTSRPYHSVNSALLWATSGIGIRHATENICYMLKSPIIIDFLYAEFEKSQNDRNDSNVRRTVYGIKTDKIARAYFHGECDGFELNRYQNLYFSGKQKKTCSLIKPRILDYIRRIRYGACSFLQLNSYLLLFDYDEDDIVMAINDLLDKRRSLIWSSGGLKCDVNSLITNDNLTITALGQGYYDKLFGEYCYIESCLAKTLDETLKISDIYSFHKEIEKLDMIEIKAFCRNRDSLYYFKLHKAIISISFLHVEKVVIGISKRQKEQQKDDDDTKAGRQNYIEYKVNEILKESRNEAISAISDTNIDLVYGDCTKEKTSEMAKPVETQEMKVVKLFLASSSELKNERDRVEIWINRENNRLIGKGIFLKLNHWGDFLDAMSKTRLQSEYNKTITQSDIFISMFASKVGKYTEEEFEIAYCNFKKNNMPKYVYTYFIDKQINISDIDEDEFKRFKKFQKKLEDLEHFPTRCNNTEDLLWKLKTQLEKIFEHMGL